MSINLAITYKEKELNILADESNTIKWVKQELKKQTKIPVLQQELSYKEGEAKHVLTDNEMPLKVAKLSTNHLTLKNLGKQIRWQMVFYIQYLGPILIFPLFYLLGNKELYTDIQTTALVLAILHYVKREYETAYVHVFSRQSMPFKRVMINSFHYWVLFALFNATELFFFPTGQTYSHTTIGVLVGLWTVFELLNYKCHKILGDFRRSPKSKQDKEYINAAKERQIPYGFGFDQVSCANYLWEALGWIIYSILTRNYTAYIFTVFSIVQMAKWAVEKHRRYKKEFGDKYPKGRKAMFPFIL